MINGKFRSCLLQNSSGNKITPYDTQEILRRCFSTNFLFTHLIQKSQISLSFFSRPKLSIPNPRHVHLPSALQLFLLTGSASISWAQQPASITSHLCLCHRGLDTLTAPLMWARHGTCLTICTLWWPEAIPTTTPPPPFPFIIFIFLCPPSESSNNPPFQRLSPLGLVLLQLPWHEGCSSVKLPSPPLITLWCCVCRNWWCMALCGLSPLDLQCYKKS